MFPIKVFKMSTFQEDMTKLDSLDRGFRTFKNIFKERRPHPEDPFQ